MNKLPLSLLDLLICVKDMFLKLQFKVVLRKQPNGSRAFLEPQILVGHKHLHVILIRSHPLSAHILKLLS